MRWIMFWAAMTGMAMAEGEPAGEFDYYVMALSWSPNFCAIEGDAKGSEQCAPGRDHGWVLHGLWPQFERGWPSYCNTVEANPSMGQTEAMADIMGSSGLAWYQWKKHGRCSGLEPKAYFALSREAYESVERPGVLRRLEDTVAGSGIRDRGSVAGGQSGVEAGYGDGDLPGRPDHGDADLSHQGAGAALLRGGCGEGLHVGKSAARSDPVTGNDPANRASGGDICRTYDERDAPGMATGASLFLGQLASSS